MGYKVVVDFDFVLLCFQGSLTLEEKQKLAKEQEQAQKLKSQQPLKPQVHTPIAPVKQVSLFLQCQACLRVRSGVVNGGVCTDALLKGNVIRS